MYFQDIILTLQRFWANNGCVILQPYDMEVGAGTSHPATTLRCLEDKPWNVVYAQPCRRPADGRYGENPNRMQHYYQLQVILKPSPENIQELCIESLESIGLSKHKNDMRFVEDDWKNPTIGAWGLGWELWCNGMEVLQFTYMQQIGGIEYKSIPAELTYGLERIAMYIQGINSVWDLAWNNRGVKYSDIFLQSEKEYCQYNFKDANIKMLSSHFHDYISEAERLAGSDLAQPAYDICLKASHVFNILEARGALSIVERESFMAKIRNVAKACCQNWVRNSTAS